MEDNKDTVNVENVEQETTIKTYTEQELQQKAQESFNAGVKKANSDWQKDKDYKEFLDWKKSNQNDGEKITELETSNSKLAEENRNLKATIKVAESDVKKEFSKFVVAEVLSNVDESTDFETALKDYKKNNPQYFGEVVFKKVQTSPKLSGGIPVAQTTNDIMNNILRNRN